MSSRPRRTARRRAAGCCAAGLLAPAALLLAGCTSDPPGPLPSAPSTSAGAASADPSTSPAIVEPTTTNTLPPPPAPTAPAPSTAGPLDARSLPVPTGWRTVVLPGSEEEGYQGNGRWVHARDPRYAAQAAVTIGCADVTRDDYPDPTAALEGNLRRGSAVGVGLVLEFADEAAASRYLTVYRAQVQACTAPGQEPAVRVIAEPRAADGGQGLIDRRTYPDGGWIEVVERNGARLTLIILADPKMARAAAQAVLDQITP